MPAMQYALIFSLFTVAAASCEGPTDASCAARSRELLQTASKPLGGQQKVGRCKEIHPVGQHRPLGCGVGTWFGEA